MTESEIKDYRKILEAEYSSKDLEIDTTLSYITIGSLGFFITINDKFLKIQDAVYPILLIISLSFLFISFVLLLLRKSYTMRNAYELMTLLDRINPDSEEQDASLYKIWEKGHNTLTTVRSIVYVLLSFGIGLQVLFLLLNVTV